ncbi:23S rRNA (uracil(1939)-C(5))-methyltransferase RlmD [Kaarinaea lacus]
MSRRRKKLPEPRITTIESLSHDGRGISHVDGKVVFIHCALPGEEVRFRYCRTRGKFDEGDVLDVIKPSPLRIEPRCQHFGICGGCSQQHLAAETQIRFKQERLLDNFERIGNVTVETILPPLTADSWGYRRKARLGVQYMRREQVVRVGFRERSSSFLADLTRCEVLHPRIGEHISDLSRLVGKLSIKDKIPQIEVAVGDDNAALVFRHLETLSEQDLQLLKEYGRNNDLLIYLQPGGPKTVNRLYPDEQPDAGIPGKDTHLSYRLPEYDIELSFQPTDFTQVNAALNQKMIALALKLLDPQPKDRVLDLFCGLGNFSLPLAKSAGAVVGVEGEAGLVQRARENALNNGIDNIEFYAADLSGDLTLESWYGGGFDKLLLDPPRSGAPAVVARLPSPLPSRIVYVSCDPATLARDAGTLVNEHGYRLVAAGVMDMFPHTAHVESIAMFER